MLDIVQSISFKYLAKIFGGFLALDGRLFFPKKFSFIFLDLYANADCNKKFITIKIWKF